MTRMTGLVSTALRKGYVNVFSIYWQDAICDTVTEL